MKIHPTAIVDKKAQLDTSVEIGPWTVIEGNVKIASGVKIMGRCNVFSGTEIGENTVVHPGAVLGNEPQDKAFTGAESFTRIGKNTIIRENVTVHRGTGEGTVTVIGDNNFIMVAAHIGHNCTTEDDVIIVNNALLAGHVYVEKGAFISGGVVFHQFCRIGRYAMIGGFSGVNKDVPPYMIVRGPSAIRGVNVIGLKRARIAPENRKEIKEAYSVLYLSENSQEEALKKLKRDFNSEEIVHLVAFIENSKRGICKIRYGTETYF